MIPFSHAVSYSETGVSGTPRHVAAFVAHAIAWLAAVLALALVGWSAAKALGSPLLAIVASGMLFLIGVALRSAVEPRHP